MTIFYATGQKRNPPLSLALRGVSSSDYESIPSLDTTTRERLTNAFGKGLTLSPVPQGSNSPQQSNSSDYESITSFGNRSSGRRSHPLLRDISNSNNSSLHDYETIESLQQNISSSSLPLIHHQEGEEEDYAHISPDISELSEEVDLLGSSLRGSTRHKLLKIDSQGYASVLLPTDVDNTWEFDCLNQQDTTNHQRVPVNPHFSKRSNTMPISLPPPPPPPPSFGRVRSDKFSTLPPPPPPAEPQDYEVPMELLQAAATAERRRKTSLVKQQAVTPEDEPDTTTTNRSRETSSIFPEHGSTSEERESAASSSDQQEIQQQASSAPAIITLSSC